MNVNLNLYKYFLEVAKRNSFTKAANELLISQPSLSYSIKVLEEQLGYKLFNRDKGKIALTMKGKSLYQKLENIFKNLEDIDNDNKVNGNIYIGIRPLLALYALPPYINELIRIYPDLNIQYKMAGNEDLIEGLKKGEYDFIIDEYNYHSKDIISIECKDKESKSGFVMASRYYEDILITEDYLKKNKILISDKNKYSIDFINKYQITNYEEVSGTPVLIEELMHNKKIAYSNLFVLKKEIENGNIKVLRTDLDLPSTTIMISYNKNSINKKSKTVIDFIKDYKMEEILSLTKQNEDK